MVGLSEGAVLIMLSILLYSFAGIQESTLAPGAFSKLQYLVSKIVSGLFFLKFMVSDLKYHLSSQNSNSFPNLRKRQTVQ